MGLFDTLVYVIKSDIRIIKNALDNGQENDDGIVCDIIPEHDFSLMLKDISDDAVQVGR